jgi:hypothetical protein
MISILTLRLFPVRRLCAAALPLFVLAACSQYDVPLGPPSTDVLDDRLIGAWFVEDGDDPEPAGGLYVSRFNDAEYLITLVDSTGGNDHLRAPFARQVRYPPGIRRRSSEEGPFFYAAHLTVFEDVTFLNVRRLAREPVPLPDAEAGWWIVRVDVAGDRVLLHELKIELPEGEAHTSSALQRALAGRVLAPDIYAEDVTVLQRLPVPGGGLP